MPLQSYLPKGARIARVAVRAKQHLARLAVALLCQCHVAHALVVWVGLEVAAVGDVIEVLDVVLVRHLPVRWQVSMRRVGRWCWGRRVAQTLAAVAHWLCDCYDLLLHMLGP